MKRIMAIDLGDVRTGIAISDATRSITGDAFIIKEPSRKKLAARILELVSERDIEIVILGNPINMDGSHGFASQKSEAFAALLQNGGAEVVLQDERMSTIEAANILNTNNSYGKSRKAKIDAIAASLILEAYLNSRDNNKK